ncbi:MAG: 6-phosphogluconolactonase [Rhodobacteraceae bacterium]|nr:6-phosphogluconolactonase [Paracoccaceae bacterium]
MKVTLAEYRDDLHQAEMLATLVAAELTDALSRKGHATLAVPGGETPRTFLHTLSRKPIAWGRVSVMLTDERFVPESNLRSNTRMMREHFLQGPAAKSKLVPLFWPAASPEVVLERLSLGVKQALPLDVCVLGMGVDGHVASLFPGGSHLVKAMAPDCKQYLMPMRSDALDEPRLTLTANVLRAASHIHILIVGPEKLAALKAAEQAENALVAPVRAILTAPNPVTVHYAEKAHQP